MKKIIAIIVLIMFSLVSCQSKPIESSSNSDRGKYTATVKQIVEYFDCKCSYNDSGFYNESAYFYNDYVKGEKRSVPRFDYWYIDKKSTNSKIPSFIMAGDRIVFSHKRIVDGWVNDSGSFITHPIAIAFEAILFNNDSDLEYYRAEVKEIEESKIHRDENGYVTGIDYYGYDVTQHITIDKEYYYINLNEYKGGKIYVSGSGGYLRLYSFNPLEV